VVSHLHSDKRSEAGTASIFPTLVGAAFIDGQSAPCSPVQTNTVVVEHGVRAIQVFDQTTHITHEKLL
jgi:hypothetical protein